MQTLPVTLQTEEIPDQSKELDEDIFQLLCSQFKIYQCLQKSDPSLKETITL